MADNYDDVNMDMGSDSDESGSEMFGNKKEYEAFKKHFSSKSSSGSQQKPAPRGEYGGDEEAGSEYGGGTDKIAVVGNKFGHTEGQTHGERGATGPSALVSGEKKVERKAVMYGDRDQRDSGRRSKSRDRHPRRRSGSRDRDRDRHRDRDYRKRSRSRSPNRGHRSGGHHHHRGGRDRQDNRDRRREDGARNHENQMQKAREMGVELPKYLKPGAVNPLSYAEQMQKRKALFGRKPAASANEEAGPPGEAPTQPEPTVESQPSNASNKPEPKRSFNNWESTNFGNDTANEKFRRLMGIKTPGESSAPKTDQSRPVPGKDHEKIMNDLDRNYEVARQQTHRNRGMGMGFSSDAAFAPQMAPAPAPAPAPSLGAGNMFRNAGWQNRASGGINFVKKP